ncbi:hypothetical protein IBX73_03420 [candidate division WOR-3 bacterium]|nr:hypothetical protein [candidate division WOR-3 bacterium]
MLAIITTLSYGQGNTYYFIEIEGIGGQSVPPYVDAPDLLEVQSDSIPPTPPGFRSTSIEEIHRLGYTTPSEDEAEAEQQGNMDAHEDRGSYWSSYISLGFQANQKWTKCGSKTSRSWYNPGSLALKCQTRLNGALIADYPWHPTWGWYTKYSTNKILYPINVTWTWNQHGWHHWGNPAGMKESNITRTW